MIAAQPRKSFSRTNAAAAVPESPSMTAIILVKAFISDTSDSVIDFSVEFYYNGNADR
jgi:hypothetical protein